MPRKNLQIPVYKAERDDGIGGVIQSNASINYMAQLQDTELSKEVAKEFLRSVSSEVDEKQFDLYYLNTILVTTGCNLNFDVFDKVPVWTSRYTPIQKPFNLEHDQSKIIGHMTSAKAVNEKFELIDDDTSIDDLPDKFHILTGAVIYRALADEEAQKNIDKIIEEIEKDEWYVSMECLFRGFDYAVFSSTGEQRVIPRNEETAFLTKHLRQYGGTGKYNDFTLGRLLKDITFSGKGLVRKPANPESVIFNENVSKFKAVSADLGYINTSRDSSSNKTKDISNVNVESTMADVNKDDPKVGELERQISDLKAKNKELADKVKESETSVTTAKITSLETDVKTKDEKITQLQSEVTTATTKVTELEGKLKEAETKASRSDKELADLKAERVTETRVAMLVKIDAPEDEAKNLVSLFADKNEDQFKTIVGLFSDKWKKKEEPKSAAASNEPSPAKSDKTEPVSKNPLDDAKPEPAPALAANTDNDDVEPLRKSMAALFEQVLGGPPIQTKNGEKV